MTVGHDATATAGVIDKNDVLNTIQIYNADAMGLSAGKYDVKGTDGEGDIDLGETMDYDATMDRLVWTHAEGFKDLEMPTLQSITFTKAT